MRTTSRLQRSTWMRRTTAALLAATVSLSACAGAARASSDDDDDTGYDARVQGYTPNAEVKKVGLGGTWMLVVFLSVATAGVMFMKSNRTHLD